MEQEAINKAQETLAHVNKTYGLSLSQISVVKIDDKEYLKFYDSQTNTIKMIENSSKNLNEYFTELQQKLSFAQSNNEISNAKNIFDYEEKYVKSSIKLVPILELESNLDFYITNIDKEKEKPIMFLIKNARVLNITHINLEKGIYVNSNQEVLFPAIDEMTGNYVIRKAEVKVYEDKNVQVDQDNYLLEMDGVNFDEVVEGIDLTVPSEQPLIIAGEVIDLSTLNNYIQYPELLDRQVQAQQISIKRKTILQYLIDAYQRKLARKTNTNAKILVLKYPDKAAFADAFLLAILSSLAAAIITVIVYF